jgi:hypothetical protein
MPSTASAIAKQFWRISAHDHLLLNSDDHLLLNSDRARAAQPRNSAHLSKRFCLTASREALEARLEQLADPTMRMACINVLDAVVDKVPDALRFLWRRRGRPYPSKRRLVEHRLQACECEAD